MTAQFVPPSASTRAMSFDRGNAGKLVGHLFIAAKTLLQGRAITMDEMRHEIRSLMNKGAADNHSGRGAASHPDATSLAAWNKMIADVIIATRKIPNATGSLPDDFKRELARSIRHGRKLCSGGGPATREAREEIGRASELYLKLSGTSYL